MEEQKFKVYCRRQTGVEGTEGDFTALGVIGTAMTEMSSGR